jgi:hypothetical protein
MRKKALILMLKQAACSAASFCHYAFPTRVTFIANAATTASSRVTRMACFAFRTSTHVLFTLKS